MGVGFLVSCKSKDGCDAPPPYLTLSDSLKLWLPYTANKDLYFADTLAHSDTLYLRNISTGDNDYNGADKCPTGKAQYLKMSFVDAKTVDTIAAELGQASFFTASRKSKRWTYNEITKRIELAIDASARFDDSVVLNKKAYYKSISVSCSAGAPCDPTGITMYYFSSGKGLVGYVRNNKLWTLK